MAPKKSAKSQKRVTSQSSPSSSSVPTSPTPQETSNTTASLVAKPTPISTILGDILLLRLINAIWLSTFFQPDEFFQSLEPAWELAFGSSSGAWITWEWRNQLRSSIHPILFSGAYLLAELLSRVLPGELTTLLIGAPKVLQGLIAALGDWYTWRLARKVYQHSGNNISLVALTLQLFNPWQFYVSTRTFSNSLETSLTAAALYYFPWSLLSPAETFKENSRPKNPAFSIWGLRASYALSALAVVLRPTNVLIWITIIFFVVTRLFLKGPSPVTLATVLVLFREAVVVGSLILALSAASDRFYYGFWSFPPYRFLNFNISQSLAVFYGRSPWHYYLLQGLPLLCTTALAFALPALYKPYSRDTRQHNVLRVFSCTVLTTVLALSFISHKEVRFIYPLLPLLTVLSAPYAASFFTEKQSQSTSSKVKYAIKNKAYLFAALGINALLAFFLTTLHQPAPLNVLAFLRTQYASIHPSSTSLQVHDQSQELFALFLMPCHSTPWRSHLLYPSLRAYALSCEPPLHTEPNTPERDNYRDEADRFYDSPVAFLKDELFAPSSGIELPRYIVGFEGIDEWLHEYSSSEDDVHLSRVWEGFNGFFNEDWRRAGKVIVWDTGVHQG